MNRLTASNFVCNFKLRPYKTESEFHESWRDENGGAVLWNLGAFIVGYAIMAAVFAASVFASAAGSSGVGTDG